MYRYRKFSFLFLVLSLLLAGCAPNVKDPVPSSSVHIHNYRHTVVKATYASEGYTLHKCTDCGEKYKDNFTQMPTEVVSSLAQKDFLQPFEDYSRQRKHNPQFVMVHFSSAVVLDQNDPYNMDTIRNIFVDYKVSTHYIIDRDGNIFCYIPEDLVAYHAGYGTWLEETYTDNFNNYSFGIELAAIGSQTDMAQYLTEDAYQKLPSELIGYTDAQYTSLKNLIVDICTRNDIPMDRQHIIGHQEYSPKKTDPGELFDWDRLFA